MKTLAIVRHSMHETIHRGASLGALLVPWIMLGLFIAPVTIRDKQVYMWNRPQGVSGANYAREITQVFLGTTSSLWTFLTLLAMAGLVTVYFQKGWVELFFSKPLHRVSLLVGCYLTGLTLWTLSAGVTLSVPAFYFQSKLGVPATPLLKALAVETLVFAVLLAFLLLILVVHAHATMGVLAVYLLVAVSSAMLSREDIAKFLNSRVALKILDFCYYVLPKVSEMGTAATNLARNIPVKTWMPLWSSGLFGLGALILAGWILHRKSY